MKTGVPRTPYVRGENPAKQPFRDKLSDTWVKRLKKAHAQIGRKAKDSTGTIDINLKVGGGVTSAIEEIKAMVFGKREVQRIRRGGGQE